MKISDQYSHKNGLEGLLTHNSIFEEIPEILNEDNLVFGINSPFEIKEYIGNKFNNKGWADKVKVGNTGLTISFLKSKVGVCFQIGNVARTYADILKICQLYNKGVIHVGVIIVPRKVESKILGANYAQFERLSKELAQFTEIVSAPILVIGLSN